MTENVMLSSYTQLMATQGDSMVRTSATHPLQIAEIAAGGGVIGMTFCPGKQSPSLYGAAWERDLGTDISAIRTWGAKEVVTLMERHEFDALRVPNLGERIQAAGMAWVHLPIRDVSVPDAGFIAIWADLTRALRDRLAAGDRILLHCRGGLGRTGLVAALLLVDLGWSINNAIAAVRSVRPGAIETPEQEAYVRSYLPGLCHAALLAGAMGDSLGADIEFLSLAAIRHRFPTGVDRLSQTGSVAPGWFTDDTQMTLFTAEGLIEGLQTGTHDTLSLARSVHAALLRWERTQSAAAPAAAAGPGLIGVPQMWYPAAPGVTCLSALRTRWPLGTPARNESKGCGTIMRVAPVGFAVPRDQVRAVAIATSALTHGHPVGQLAAAAWAELLADVAAGEPMEATARALAKDYEGMGGAGSEVAAAMHAALAAPRDGHPETVEGLGGAWVAEEALSIALYATLCAETLEQGLQIAVTHSGDSDSTGAIAGNLLGLLHPDEVFSHRWLQDLGGRNLIARLAPTLPLARHHGPERDRRA